MLFTLIIINVNNNTEQLLMLYGFAADLNLKSNGPRVGVCMDKKLEQALLNLEELQKNPGDDEILTEIKKCQQELKSVNTYNLNELTKLRRVVQSDIQKQQVKEELEKVDNQVMMF